MAYDVAIDLATGDLMFGPSRDLLGTTGPELDKQRIHVRCKIPRGTYIYDEDGSLGSNLHLISRTPTERQLRDAEVYISEALEDAEGISVESIDVQLDSENRVSADIKFTQTTSLDDEGEEIEEDVERPVFDARISFSEQE